MHFAVLTSICFALTGLCAAQASHMLGAGRANAWRLVIAVVILATWSQMSGVGMNSSGLPWFIFAGGIGFGLGGWCTFQALRRVGSTLTLLVAECSAAVFAILIGYWILGASLRPVQALFVAMVISGVLLGITSGPIRQVTRQQLRAGCSFAVLGAVFQATSINVSSHAFSLMKAAGEAIHPHQAAYQRLLGGAAVAVTLHLILLIASRNVKPSRNSEGSAPFPNNRLPAPVWVSLNALFGPVLGVTCLLWAVSLVKNPGLVQTVAATATLLTVLPARRLEDARPGLRYFIGCAIALGGVAGLWLA